jgi:hypothetical protein
MVSMLDTNAVVQEFESLSGQTKTINLLLSREASNIKE